MTDTHNRINSLYALLQNLTDGQFDVIETIAHQFKAPHQFTRPHSSDIIDDCVLQDFGDLLRIHHCFSSEAFTKDKFEYALERVLRFCGHSAERAPRGNPGYDILIDDQTVSLKTQADKSIRDDSLYISKFMELGRGEWADQESDLVGLRDRFFEHMNNYERIFSLRRLPFYTSDQWRYELVEIPKSLLFRARDGQLEMMSSSRQSPKPGYCHVYDRERSLLFQLYFDGGTERKLQIKNIDKAHCIVHAYWEFVIIR